MIESEEPGAGAPGTLRPLMLAVAALCALITVFVLLPVHYMEMFLYPLNQALYHYLPGAGVSAGKLGHAVAFFLLTLMAMALCRRQRLHWWWGFVALVGFAVGTELLQIAIDGRTTRLRDLLFDVAGIGAAGLLFAALLLKLSISSTDQAGASPTRPSGRSTELGDRSQ